MYFTSQLLYQEISVPVILTIRSSKFTYLKGDRFFILTGSRNFGIAEQRNNLIIAGQLKIEPSQVYSAWHYFKTVPRTAIILDRADRADPEFRTTDSTSIVSCHCCVFDWPHDLKICATTIFACKYCNNYMESPGSATINQRTNGPVNAHLISWPSKAQNIQNLKNIW